jgi:cell division protein FtsL
LIKLYLRVRKRRKERMRRMQEEIEEIGRTERIGKIAKILDRETDDVSINRLPLLLSSLELLNSN